jgi:hypothetical protein
MKYQKTNSPFYLFLLLIFLTIGTIFSVRTKPTAPQEVQLALAKSNTLQYDDGVQEDRDYGKELSYLVPLIHFEPLLLFMLGTLLLSIVTGVNLVRARKIGLHLHSHSQANLQSHQKFRARNARSRKDSAA